jgi:adenylate cyclase
MGKSPQVSEDIIIIAVDNESARQMDIRIPTPRNFLADLINYLNQAQPRIILLDVLLDQEYDPQADRALAEAIRNAGNVLLPVELGGSKSDELLPIVPIFRNASFDTGFANLIADRDDRYRRLLLARKLKNSDVTFAFPFITYLKYKGMDLNKLKADFRDDEIIQSLGIPFDPYGRMIINFSKASGEFSEGGVESNFPKYPAYLFFPEEKPPSVFFKDKLVLIGATHKDSRDSYFMTPFYTVLDEPGFHYMAGVEILANAINTLMLKDFIRPLGLWENHLLALAVIILSAIILMRVGALKGLVIVCAELLLFFLLLLWFFVSQNISISPTEPISAIAFTYVGSVLYGFSREERAKIRTRKIFQNYVSPKVVDVVLKSESDPALGGQSRTVTILFSDIFSYSSISERLKPYEIIEFLNKYLDEMTEVIFKYDGTLGKFIGDGIMAYYGAPIPYENHALKAVMTAVEMQDRVRKLRESWANSEKEYLRRLSGGELPIRIGVGIHTGEVVVGNIGSKVQMDYTVIGDPVNAAARLESLNRIFPKPDGYEIIISDETYQQVKDHIEAEYLGAQHVKGKKEAVEIYRIVSLKGEKNESLET